MHRGWADSAEEDIGACKHVDTQCISADGQANLHPQTDRWVVQSTLPDRHVHGWSNLHLHRDRWVVQSTPQTDRQVGGPIYTPSLHP